MADVIIELRNVIRTYKLGDETIRALHKVNFKVKTGDYVAITGASGSGKSTLVNIIGGLDTPTGGTVTVDKHNLSHLKDDSLSVYRNQYIGFVFQSFNLLPHDTVLENVALPLVFSGVKPEERKKRAAECLNLVGLSHRLNHKPAELSSGQQQLAAIARALITNPQILIADEPTGNLDSGHGAEVYSIIQKINSAGTTVLVVTHDVNMAHLAGRIVQMSDGKLTELSG